MPTVPQAFLTFARYLFAREPDEHEEAQLRTVVNRSYLACVSEAAKILEPLVGRLPRDYHFYGEVERGLVNRSAPRSKDKLFDLRRRRKEADYSLDSAFTRHYTEESLSVAEYLFSLLAEEVV